MPHLSKTVCGIFHVSIQSRFIKVYIFVHKKHGCLTLKRHNSFQNQNNKKATYSFASGPDF